MSHTHASILVLQLRQPLIPFNHTFLEDPNVYPFVVVSLRSLKLIAVFHKAPVWDASELFDVIKGHLPSVHCYADDTQLYLSFSPKQENGQTDAINAMERCVVDVRKWMTRDKLLMNDNKTEFLLIGTKQQLAKVSISHITIGNTDIATQSPVRNLGVWFDSNLTLI